MAKNTYFGSAPKSWLKSNSRQSMWMVFSAMAQLLDPCVWYLNGEVFKIWTSCPVLAMGHLSIGKDCKFGSQLYLNQISANNLTPLRYSKKTWYSAITQVQKLSRIGGYNSTRVIFESELYEQ